MTTALRRAWFFTVLARVLKGSGASIGHDVEAIVTLHRSAGPDLTISHVDRVGVAVTVGSETYSLDVGVLLDRLAPADYADLLVPVREGTIAKPEGEA